MRSDENSVLRPQASGAPLLSGGRYKHRLINRNFFNVDTHQGGPIKDMASAKICLLCPFLRSPLPSSSPGMARRYQELKEFLHVFCPSFLLSLMASTLRCTQAERPQPALLHVGGPTPEISKIHSYGALLCAGPRSPHHGAVPHRVRPSTRQPQTKLTYCTYTSMCMCWRLIDTIRPSLWVWL